MPLVQPVTPVRQKRPVAAILVVVVAIVALCGLGGYVYWLLVPSATDTVKKVDDLNTHGQYQQSMDLLNGAYRRAFTTNDKAILMSRYASTSQLLGDNQGALQYEEQLEQLTPNDLGVVLGVADLAERTGDNSAAAAAYQQAVKLIQAQPKTPRSESAIALYSAQAERLSK